MYNTPIPPSSGDLETMNFAMTRTHYNMFIIIIITSIKVLSFQDAIVDHLQISLHDRDPEWYTHMVKDAI